MQAKTRNTVFILVAVLAAAAVVLATLLVLADSSRPRPESAGTDPARRTFALLAGIPQQGTVLGDPEAPVRLDLFNDLQCPETRGLLLGALPFVIRRWVRSGQLKLDFRSTKSDTLTAREFEGQQVAAMAAGEQNRLWHYAYLFYRQQGIEFSGYMTPKFLSELAVQSGLDLDRWEADRDPARWAPQLRADHRLARSHRLVATPAAMIGLRGGPSRPLRHFSLTNPWAFDHAVEALLRRAQRA